MAYVKLVDYASKDALLPGNPSKIVKGTEIGAEFDAIATWSGTAATKAGVETLTNKTLTSPVINTPTGIVKGDVGLGNVDNTSDATKNAASVTLSNKTIALGSNTVSGTTAQFNAALSDGDFATLAGSETLTNKTIALGSNTVSGTLAQLNSAVTDADIARTDAANTFTGLQTFSGALSSTSSSVALGYGTGSGSTVTQATSKSTSVPLNRPSGQITLNNSSLGSNSTAGFTFTNSLIADTDSLIVTIKNGTGTGAAYQTWAQCDNGAASVYIRNISAGTLSEAVVLNFQLIKGAAS